MRQAGAVLLVAGTCIGSGMIALPLVLAKLGLVSSIALMLLTWLLVYYTSLINLELNLQAGRGLPLGDLGKLFSGRGAEWIGKVSLKLLSYALLAVYIYGGSSIVREYLAQRYSMHYSMETLATFFALLASLALSLPIRFIDYCNRMFFIGLLAVASVLIAGLAITIDWSHLPLLPQGNMSLDSMALILPVVFTSFGFQVIFHTLTNYCLKDKVALKRVFFFGSLIPALIYILWTSSILGAVYHENPLFYGKMVGGKAEVGELIGVLSGINKWQSVQLLVWCISLLAIITSVIGVGIGLVDSIREMLPKMEPPLIRTALSSLLTVGPAYLAVIFVPNAFISVLGFAGMILAVIAIILPTYLLTRIKGAERYYPELKRRYLVGLSFLMAIIVVLSEIWNML